MARMRVDGWQKSSIGLNISHLKEVDTLFLGYARFDVKFMHQVSQLCPRYHNVLPSGLI